MLGSGRSNNYAVENVSSSYDWVFKNKGMMMEEVKQSCWFYPVDFECFLAFGILAPEDFCEKQKPSMTDLSN